MLYWKLKDLDGHAYSFPIPRVYCSDFVAERLQLNSPNCVFKDNLGDALWCDVWQPDEGFKQNAKVKSFVDKNGTAFTYVMLIVQPHNNMYYGAYFPKDSSFSIYQYNDRYIKGVTQAVTTHSTEMMSCIVYNIFDKKFYLVRGCLSYTITIDKSNVGYLNWDSFPNNHPMPSPGYNYPNDKKGTYKAIFYIPSGYSWYTSQAEYVGDKANKYFTDYFGDMSDGDDNPDFPDGDEDDDSDDINPNPNFPQSATGFISLYAPTASELSKLASFMWSKDFLDIFLKLQQDPYQSIISLKCFCCSLATSGSTNIILGNVDSKVGSAEIKQQYQQFDCGTINVSRYFGSFLDYNPYTSIKIYLPFIGYRELDVDEVMNASLHLYYNVDALTGACVALINVSKDIKGTNLNSVLYQFDGMIANELPISAADYTQVASALMRGIATTAAAIGISAATGGAGAGAGVALGSAVVPEKAIATGVGASMISAVDTVTTKINVQHGGSMGGSMGALAVKQPYLIINRVIPKNPSNYGKLHGYPSNIYRKLSTLSGFTKMQDIQIKSTIGSVDETEEIKQLLLDGVVI